ncbi:Cytoplasmic 60S subunit biogenesis factor REI1 [Cyphellophora attinorum]|uniref:Cytoplasmic 60S subunit biogenesis factor REI1 n=1 Tax=Cyphellophora attinorum TaxID=1664694 RepID=A0A0N1HF64_9EURO|nr:Cytoplasmic 60S subunit biogenesis factor REI1 [Phialophora attinorum]KPI43733.1 Cytoplasmic 60S subunit biogenesis factor REI1 [Phialophora attinorum]
MDSASQRGTPSPTVKSDHSSDLEQHEMSHPFDPHECLFCNQESEDIDHNVQHMSKAHGLRIEMKDLLVEVVDLLAYCHLIISECYECLYCGTQRNTHQAAQQHMMAKGHCKYDLEDPDSEFRDFYEHSSTASALEEERQEGDHRDQPANSQKLAERAQGLSLAGSRRMARRQRPNRSDPDSGPHNNRAEIRNAQNPQADTSDTSTTSPADAAPSTPHNQLSNRALKAELRADHQLSQLRDSDRRSLAHLPLSQQRALLATQHNQMVQARKEEQTQRGRLESAGNSFGRLGTTRLVRIPPHLGHVQTLKR